MDIYAQIREKLRYRTAPAIFTAQVRRVSGTTCTVDVDGLELSDVRLCPVIDSRRTQLLITPKTDSMVLVADLSMGDLTDLAVVHFGETEKIEIHGGSLGGLVKIDDLTRRLNAIERDLNTVKTAFAAWTPAPTDGGAALKAATAAWAASTLTLTQKSDYEDTTITH